MQMILRQPSLSTGTWASKKLWWEGRCKIIVMCFLLRCQTSPLQISPYCNLHLRTFLPGKLVYIRRGVSYGMPTFWANFRANGVNRNSGRPMDGSRRKRWSRPIRRIGGSSTRMSSSRSVQLRRRLLRRFGSARASQHPSPCCMAPRWLIALVMRTRHVHQLAIACQCVQQHLDPSALLDTLDSVLLTHNGRMMDEGTIPTMEGGLSMRKCMQCQVTPLHTSRQGTSDCSKSRCILGHVSRTCCVRCSALCVLQRPSIALL